MVELVSGKGMRMKGGHEGLKTYLDLEINSVFSINRRKRNFFIHVEVCGKINAVQKTLGENYFLLNFIFKNPFV